MSDMEEEKDCLIDGKYAIGDLLDLSRLRTIFEKFNKATGFTLGFLSHPKLEVLIATGWREICTKFHRGYPIPCANCKKSNTRLLNQLTHSGQIAIDECDNGLVDCATPIIVKGKHIASLATGQFLLKKPDQERFREQARKYGFDEEKYLKALEEIPVVSEEQVKNVTSFLGEMAVIISELGYVNLEIKEETTRLAEEIEERKRTEGELKKYQDHLEDSVTARTGEIERIRRYLDKIINTVADPIFVKDREHRWVLLNDAYCHFMGYPREKLIGLSDFDYFPKKEAEVFWAKDEEVFKTGRENINEELFTDAAGVTHTIITKKTLYQDAEGQQLIVGIIRDVTELRNVEKELKKYQERLEELVQERTRQLEMEILERKKAESAQSELISMVSHELRTPLYPIREGLALLLEEDARKVGGEMREILVTCLANIDRLTRLINNFLDFQKFEAQKAELNFEKLSINELILDAYEMLRPSAHHKNLDLKMDLAEDLPLVSCDRDRILRVLINLINNAIKFTEKGEVTLETSLTEKGIKVSISDTGIGIRLEDIPELFKKFKQLKDGQAAGRGGTGLGLVISKTIVERHGGKIGVCSEFQKGSTFYFILPNAQEGS